MARSPLLMCKSAFLAPLPADLVSIVSAATPANGALSIAAQPVHARKLQVQAHVGTTTTTAITAGVVNISGMDQDNNAVSEAISVIANASTTFKSAYAYSQITSFTLSGYVASGSGTGNTIGVGVSNDFGIPGAVNAADFTLIKATKIITT